MNTTISVPELTSQEHAIRRKSVISDWL